MKPKIAIFLTSLNHVTGGTRRRLEIANRLTRRGYPVTAYVLDDCYELPPEWYPFELECMVDKRRHGIEADFIFAGEVFDYDREGTFLTAKGQKVWLLQLWMDHYRLALEDKTIIKVANSTHMAQRLQNEYDQEAVLAIGGVDTKFFKPRKIDKGLLLGFERKHGNYIDDIADNFGLTPAYIESQDQLELRDKYQKAFIFVSTEFEDWFGWCNPAAEAMACGCAVVAIDHGAVRDMCIDRKTAYLVQSIDEIQDGVYNLMSIPQLRWDLRKNARQHILHYDWEKVIDIIEREIIK